MKEFDLSQKAVGLTADDFISSTNPTKEDLKQAKAQEKVLVAYSKDVKKCLEFRDKLGSDVYLIIFVDPTPVILKDGSKINFEEFFIRFYLKIFKMQCGRERPEL